MTCHPWRSNSWTTTQWKSLVVHGIVRAEGGGIIVVDDRLVRMWSVVGAEVGNERRYFALKLDIERFEDVQAVSSWLATHNPVDIGIVIHVNAKRLHWVDVRVRATVERAVKRGELVSCVDGVEILLRLTDDFVIAERVEVVKIRRIIFMVFLHTPRASNNGDHSPFSSFAYRSFQG